MNHWRMVVIGGWLWATVASLTVHAGSKDALGAKTGFYRAADSRNTIVHSALESLRFTVERTLRPDEQGHLVSISSFVDPSGTIMGWHDFGHLEGPGWAANAVGGGYELFCMGRFLGRLDWQEKAVKILDHVLDCGFVDESSGFIRGYRQTQTGAFCLNYKHHSEWFCPGSMAKIAYQMLVFADTLEPDPRAARLRTLARRCAGWIDRQVEPVANGWFPRRTTPEGRIYRASPDGGQDPYWQTSADGLFILQLQAALTGRGLADYRAALREKAHVFMQAGGLFGSINHDTYDPHESVAYAVAFRTLRVVAELIADPALRSFAFERCLGGLERFQMLEDRNGVATRGLLYMETSWDTAYLWENAEAALAYFEAAKILRSSQPEQARANEMAGLVILRTIALHHYGPHGFLTEGVDWNNHVGAQHHMHGTRYGAICYTEPFLNNQHIVEPTLFYLEHLARVSTRGRSRIYRDAEGQVIFRQKLAGSR